jgi:hypothetical protein
MGKKSNKERGLSLRSRILYMERLGGAIKHAARKPGGKPGSRSAASLVVGVKRPQDVHRWRRQSLSGRVTHHTPETAFLEMTNEQSRSVDRFSRKQTELPVDLSRSRLPRAGAGEP